MTSAKPIRLADYRPDAWQRLIRPCPDHVRACGPFCVTLWAAPLDAADEDRMSEKTHRINPSNPRHVGLWRVREAPYHRKDLGGRWRALKARTRAQDARPAAPEHAGLSDAPPGRGATVGEGA